MKRLWPLLAVATTILVAIPVQSIVPDRDDVERVTEKEILAEAQAWQYSGVDLGQGFVATITASGEWKINPQWKRKVGPSGNPKAKAGKFYLKFGAAEGCLLVRNGDTVLAFSRDADTIVINKPGKIYFCANDEPTADGVTRFKDLLESKKGKHFLDALPIPALKEESGGSGFLDNSGSIKVRVAVKKNDR
jgi:hypothetical protein